TPRDIKPPFDDCAGHTQVTSCIPASWEAAVHGKFLCRHQGPESTLAPHLWTALLPHPRERATEPTRKSLKKHLFCSRLPVVRPHVVLHLVASLVARSAASRPSTSSPP